MRIGPHRFGTTGSAFIANITSNFLDKPISADPGGYDNNSTEIKGLQLSPNIRGVLFNSLPYSARYSFGNTSGDFVGSPNSHTLAGQISGLERAGSNWNWSWTGEWQRRKFSPTVNSDRSYAAGSLFLNVVQDLRLSGGINFEQIQGYQGPNNRDYGYGPFVGFNWRPVENLTVDANWSKRYYANVWQVKANYKSGSLAFGFDASKSVQTSLDSSAFLFDGLGLISSSAGNAITPVTAALLQQNLFTSFGIPFSAALITDAEVVSRKIGTAIGLVGARNSLAFSFFDTRRESTGASSLYRNGLLNSTRGQLLSGSASSSVGFFFSQFNTSSLSLNYQHRMDARSSLDIGLSATRYGVPSGLYTFNTQVTSLTGAVSTKLTPDVTAGFGARHSLQRSRGNYRQEYNESAIFGSIDMRF
jgi:uncharacterized protein (PEP-CTERM system associated)